MRRIYLDYAASTPVDSRVEAAMKPYFGKIFGNPHSLHWFGQEASGAVFESRKKIADSIGADYKEIIFTGSATEANNLALRGAIKAYKSDKTTRTNRPRIITTTIEHESVLETCRDLSREGVEVIYIPVGKDGIVDPRKIKAALNERTVLVSIIHANNEVGTIQPISEIAKIIRNFRELRIMNYESRKTNSIIHNSLFILPLLHTDAVQSFQYLDCKPAELGVDLMTISAHKIYGPKGIGALYIRPISPTGPISPIITGSGQEFGLRSGTDNVPYIVGFAKAVELATNLRRYERLRLTKLRDYFWQGLKKKIPHLQVNGSMKDRLPNNLNIYFPGHAAHDLLIKLDLAGIAVSPGAACTTRVSKSSFVLEAMGFSKARASGSLRFSLGRKTTKKEIDFAIAAIVKILKK
jgi:cysteine desulfurase